MKLYAWYFLAVSVLPYGGLGVTTPGPFPDQPSCEAHRSFVKAQQPSPTKYPVVLGACYFVTQ